MIGGDHAGRERHRCAEVEDPSAADGGVADHKAVIQRNRASGYGHLTHPKPLAMPPPSPPAVLLFTRLLLSVSTPLLGGSAGRMNVEDPTTRSNRAFPRCGVVVHLRPIEGHHAVVDDARPAGIEPRCCHPLGCRLSTMVHPLAIPPAAMGGPLIDPGGGTGAVAVLPFTWLQLMVTEPLHGGPAALPLPLEIPPPLRDVLPLTWLALTVTRAQQVLDATASRVRGHVAVDLAGVDGQKTGGAGEVHVVAVGDTAADKALSSVVVDLAGVEGRRTEHVHDATAAQASCLAGRQVWLLSVTRLRLRVSFATLVGSKVALAMPPPARLAVLPMTWLRFKVTVPPMLAMPPPT